MIVTRGKEIGTEASAVLTVLLLQLEATPTMITFRSSNRLSRRELANARRCTDNQMVEAGNRTHATVPQP